MTDSAAVAGKYVLAAAVAFVMSMHEAVLFLLLFMALDYFSGMIAASINGELSSDIGWIGAKKKVMTMILVVGAHLAQRALFRLSGWSISVGDVDLNFGAAVAVVFIINELISITENAQRAGVKVPPQLLSLLEKGKRMDFWQRSERRKSAIPNPDYRGRERRKRWRGRR